MNILEKLKQVQLFKLGDRSGGVVGLDIGSSSVKIVELERRRGKIFLARYGTLALGPYAKGDVGTVAKLSTQKLVAAIQSAFQAIGIKGKRGGISIPLKLSLIVTIDIPESAKDRLEQVVPLEARKYIPVPPSEVNMAWSVVSQPESKSLSKEKVKNSKDSNIKVLVAAIHTSSIEHYQEIAGKIGLAPVMFEIETFSAMRAVLGDTTGVFLMLDVGSEVTKVIIIDYGSVTFSHTIHRGSQAFSNAISSTLGIGFDEAEIIKRKVGMLGSHKGTQISGILEEDVEYIVSGAKRVISEFEKKEQKKIEKVILIGGGALLKGLDKRVESGLGKDVLLGNPFTGIELPTPVLAPILKENGPEFTVAIGMALRALKEI